MTGADLGRASLPPRVGATWAFVSLVPGAQEGCGTHRGKEGGLFRERGTRPAWEGPGKGGAVGLQEMSGQCGVRMALMGKAWNSLLWGHVFLAVEVIHVDAGLILVGGGGGNVVTLMVTAGMYQTCAEFYAEHPAWCHPSIIHSASQPFIHSFIHPSIPSLISCSVSSCSLLGKAAPTAFAPWGLTAWGCRVAVKAPLLLPLLPMCPRFPSQHPLSSRVPDQICTRTVPHLESPALLARGPFFRSPPNPAPPWVHVEAAVSQEHVVVTYLVGPAAWLGESINRRPRCSPAPALF